MIAEPSLETPDGLRLWLSHTDSFSQLMRKHASNLSVTVLGEAEKAFTQEEQALLGEKETSGWIRETLFSAEGVAWVAARVAVPRTTFSRYQTAFESIGTGLLGEKILYQTPRWERGALQTLRVHREQCSSVIQPHVTVRHTWARFSVFHNGSDQLAVTEILLPNIPGWKGSDAPAD